MKPIGKKLSFLVLAATMIAGMQQSASAQNQQSAPLVNIHVAHSTQAVNYRDRTSTKIDFQGTALSARAQGKADIDAREGRVAIKSEFQDLQPPTSFGSAYLTYVLWAITPEGRPNNLGELLLDGSKSKLEATTKLQTFALIVTAEPYFAVSFPSEVVVLENVVRKDTKGQTTSVEAKYDLLQRGTYDSMNLSGFTMDEKTPLALYEARNAARIALAEQADKYAADSWAKAKTSLDRAEDYQVRKQRKAVPTAAREAVQNAEDARAISVKKQEQERIAQQQAAEAAQTAQAQAAQEAEAQRRAEAEKQSMQAQVTAAEEAKRRAEAEVARQAALAQEAQARDAAAQSAQAAQNAQAQAAQSEREKQELRAKLLEQFNRILETKDTSRGLVVNVGDVLFDTAKFTLRPPAREALAKLSGIVLNYPGLRLQVEGHTDSTGAAEFNQKLSEQRANSVRDYLAGQGIDAGAITAAGFGPTMPVADNSSPQGRQKNRRVEIVVSGEVIGTSIGAKP